MVPSLQVVTQVSPVGTRVLVDGEVDVATAHEITAALLRAERTGTGPITLDLSGVTFMDSSGLSALVAASDRSRNDGNRLSMLTSDAVDRLIDLCVLRDRLPPT